LVEQARRGRFGRDDLSGGTFTVSNMGMLDLEDFAAVINPPQAAILAVGSIKERAVVRDGTVVPRRTMRVTVSCDHRIIDGVVAGRFLEELKRLLENPIMLVVRE
jgi:pyruvate dehydrogenase E2 component (dihydrolipoamide acetyltransferase)